MKERLRQWRESHGWSQKDLAEKVGRPTNTYGSYETGKAEPDIDLYEKLAVLGCDIHWLITGVKAGEAEQHRSLKLEGALEERRSAFGELNHEVGEALRQCAGLQNATKRFLDSSGRT